MCTFFSSFFRISFLCWSAGCNDFLFLPIVRKEWQQFALLLRCAPVWRVQPTKLPNGSQIPANVGGQRLFSNAGRPQTVKWGSVGAKGADRERDCLSRNMSSLYDNWKQRLHCRKKRIFIHFSQIHHKRTGFECSTRQPTAPFHRVMCCAVLCNNCTSSCRFSFSSHTCKRLSRSGFMRAPF